jgi:membrane-associated phospholipid phosphatase
LKSGLPGLRFAAASAIVCLAVLFLPGRSNAQSEEPARSVHPELRWLVDAPIVGVGVTLLAIGNPLDVTRKVVPDQGLDPSDIHWSIDRNTVGERSTKADNDSDYFRDAAVAYPLVLAFVSQPSGERLSGTLRRSLVYVEAILVSEGVSAIIKNSTDRPRPFTYLPIDERPDNPAYDVTSDEAFRSMPSGHATISFCAASFAITDHLLSRPEADWKEHAGVGFIGGLLAGLTASLRVEGGQHFPSDTIVGALIGSAGGTGVPLLHHYIGAGGRRGKMPSGRAWWQALAGEAAGIGVGVVAAHYY